jgi:hypothetical protein
MIGQKIALRPSKPVGAAIFLVLGMALDLAGVATHNYHWAIASVLPWFAALLFLWNREKPFEAEFTETGLEVAHPVSFIPYEDIQGLQAWRRPANPYKAGPRSYSINVLHTRGFLRIPGRVNVPSDEIFGFLYSRFSPRSSREVHPVLKDYRRRKEEEFGPDQVWTYGARANLGRGSDMPQLRAFWLAVCLSGVVWAVLGGLLEAQGKERNAAWLAVGFSAFFFGGLVWLIFWLLARPLPRRIKDWQRSCLIICPDGLALVQGDLRGQLRWDELLDVTAQHGAGHLRSSAGQVGPGLLLKVEGAVIFVADVFDRPLSFIYEQIRYFWKAEEAPDFERKNWRLPPGPVPDVSGSEGDITTGGRGPESIQ